MDRVVFRQVAGFTSAAPGSDNAAHVITFYTKVPTLRVHRQIRKQGTQLVTSFFDYHHHHHAPQHHRNSIGEEVVIPRRRLEYRGVFESIGDAVNASTILQKEVAYDDAGRIVSMVLFDDHGQPRIHGKFEHDLTRPKEEPRLRLVTYSFQLEGQAWNIVVSYEHRVAGVSYCLPHASGLVCRSDSHHEWAIQLHYRSPTQKPEMVTNYRSGAGGYWQSAPPPNFISEDRLALWNAPVTASFWNEVPFIPIKMKLQVKPSVTTLPHTLTVRDTRIARLFLWTQWNQASCVDGISAQVMDYLLCRDEPSMTTYFRRRLFCDLRGAQHYLEHNQSSLLCAIGLTHTQYSHSHLALTLSDLFYLSTTLGNTLDWRLHPDIPDF